MRRKRSLQSFDSFRKRPSVHLAANAGREPNGDVPTNFFLGDFRFSALLLRTDLMQVRRVRENGNK